MSKIDKKIIDEAREVALYYYEILKTTKSKRLARELAYHYAYRVSQRK